MSESALLQWQLTEYRIYLVAHRYSVGPVSEVG
jgi:hypothetical protein